MKNLLRALSINCNCKIKLQFDNSKQKKKLIELINELLPVALTEMTWQIHNIHF